QRSAVFIERAAELGSALAQNNIGLMYAQGLGVKQDKRKAAGWYEKASEAGVAEAQFNLAQMYLTGDGVRQNKRKAVTLLTDAA
ncbi:tetratricopeptide repeat protein, partial [Acinetobacter baumannii]